MSAPPAPPPMAPAPPMAPPAPVAPPSAPKFSAKKSAKGAPAASDPEPVAPEPKKPVHFTTHLHRAEDLSLETLGATEGKYPDCSLADTVVVFDLDGTLKYASLTETEEADAGVQNTKRLLPKKMIRSEATLVPALQALRKAGATLLVATARGPSLLKHQTCQKVLDGLGLHMYFKDEKSPPQEMVVDEDTKVFGGDGILICSYYKPHAVIAHLERANKKPARIVFVDDFVVNVASFPDTFAQNADKECLSKLKRIDSIWADPKPLVDAGEMSPSKSENSYDDMFRPYLDLVLAGGVKKDQAK